MLIFPEDFDLKMMNCIISSVSMTSVISTFAVRVQSRPQCRRSIAGHNIDKEMRTDLCIVYYFYRCHTQLLLKVSTAVQFVHCVQTFPVVASHISFVGYPERCSTDNVVDPMSPIYPLRH